MNLARLIWQALGPMRPRFVRGIVATIVDGFAQAAAPLLMVFGLVRLAQGDASLTDVTPYAGGIVLAFIARIALLRFAWREGFAAGAHAAEVVRQRVVDHLRNVPLGVFSRWSSAKLVSLITEDCKWIYDVSTLTLTRAAAGAAMALALTLSVIVANPAAGLALLGACVLGFASFRLITGLLAKFLERRNQLIGGLMQRVGEYADGIAEFRSFNRGGAALAQFSDAISGLKTLLVRDTPPIVFLGHIGVILISLAPSLALLVGAIIGAHASTPNAYLFGAAAVLMLAVRNALLVELVRPAPILGLAIRSEKNISSFISEPALSAGNRALPNTPSDLNIEFEHVEFAYAPASRPVLRDLNFTARAGKVTAIVGPSGAGKSTILALLMRYFDTDKGSVRIGGVDVRSISPAQILSYISLVNQDVYLFKDTLRANLLLGNPCASPAELDNAIQSACLSDLIAALPNGLDTNLGDSGRTLSGGERQRVAIARALLKNAPIIALDEATSAMDPVTERQIQSAVAALAKGRTTIVIAHRLQTIVTADQIIVVDGGAVVQAGVHDHLIAKRGVYQTLWEAQLQARDWRVR